MIGTKKQKGFTLIEVLVSISVLLVISGVAVSIFLSVVMGQRTILANQDLSGQLSYSLEYMSKALRMASKDQIGDTLAGGCLGSKGLNYLLTKRDLKDGVYKGIKFINGSDNGACQEFFLDQTNGKTVIKEIKNGGNSVALTSDKINISAFKFILNGDMAGQSSYSTEDDQTQPRVTISMSANFWGSNNPLAVIQTTISQRNLNIK